MKVLIVGNGGREHALAYRASLSNLSDIVYVAPGNVGTEHENKIKNINISATDIDALVDFAKKEAIDLTIVGPEAPLVLGIVDKFKEQGLRIFGPSQKAAQLEGSKSFTKEFLKRHNIPTADFEVFYDLDKAIEYVNKKGAPIVIKADGLAAGKGVVVAMTLQEAHDALKSMLVDNSFGSAGSKVVIEDFMEGEEASFIVMSDSKNALAMATSQDHKRVGDNDTGPNTGGMGAYSPAPIVTDAVYKKVMEQIIYPTIRGMEQDGIPYFGFLYAGLMIDKAGNPRVVEFNCRFGDPETQPIMLRMQSDLVELCYKGCEENGLLGLQAQYDDRVAVGVVLAASGYPQAVRKGDEIKGLFDVDSTETKIFVAGAKRDGDKIVTDGGRVLCATALGKDVKEAKHNAYELIKSVNFNGMFYRSDIANKAIKD